MQTIGRYRVLAPIEAGMHGTLFKAYDSALDRPVTLQVISRSADRPRLSATRDARLWIGLDHPNLATVLDVPPDEGWLVVVMESLDGGSLSELIRQRQPSRLEDKLALMVQLCAGLHFAHEHGIVHGDVNPRNIFVLRNGQVKILEVGLGRLTAVDPGPGAAPRTPGYQSPEQARGRLDARSDIFSVGAVCYELMAFRPPFESDDSEEVLDRIRWDEPTPLAEADSAIPPDLVAVIDRALQKDPDRRFPNLAEMGAALTFVRRRLTDQALLAGLAECVMRVRGLRLAGSPDAFLAEEVTNAVVWPRSASVSSRRPIGGPVAGLPRTQPRPGISRWRTVAIAAGVLLAVGLGIEPVPQPAPPAPSLTRPAFTPPSRADQEAIAAVRVQMVAARNGATKAKAGRLAPRAWGSALARQRDAETALSQQAFDRARTLFASAEGAYHEAWRGAVTVAAAKRERLTLLRRAAQAAESAADEARWEAERDGASQYAATALELARQRETEARVARDGQNYELTERRFRDAEHAYQRAALEAHAVRSKSFGELLLAAFRRLAPAEVPTAPRLASWESHDVR